jgi:hypothetical protein
MAYICIDSKKNSIPCRTALGISPKVLITNSNGDAHDLRHCVRVDTNVISVQCATLMLTDAFAPSWTMDVQEGVRFSLFRLLVIIVRICAASSHIVQVMIV